MLRSRTFAIAALLAALLVAVSGGLALAHMRQAQAHSVSQSSASTGTQQTKPGWLKLSGTPQAPGAPHRRWQLVSFTFDGSQQALAMDIWAAFSFDSQGLTVTGHACNAYGEMYTWSQDRSRLIAHGAWQTQVRCIKNGVDVTEQEANYLTALGKVTTYQLDSSGITLRDDTGRYILKYA